jgi:hypothetical protein
MMIPHAVYFSGLLAATAYTAIPIAQTIVGKTRDTSESSGMCTPFLRFARRRVILSPRYPAKNIAIRAEGRVPHYLVRVVSVGMKDDWRV